MSYFVANFKKTPQRDYREESKNNLANNIFGKTSSGKATRAAALATLAGLGGLGYVNRKSLAKPLDLFSRKLTDADDRVMKVIMKDSGDTVHKHKARGFLGSNRKLKLGNIAKATALSSGAVMIPTGAGYVFANPNEKEQIKQRVGSTYGQGKQLIKSGRNWVNTLDRMERWS